MSRTIRVSLDSKNKRSPKREIKLVPDGKCDYHCKCDYCMSLTKKKIIKNLHLKEIRDQKYFFENT